MLDFKVENNEAIDEIMLPRIVSSGMVLQRDMELKIWGLAPAGEQIEVKFCSKQGQEKHRTVSNSDRQWEVMLSSQKAGGPCTMEVSGAGSNLQVEDILIGEVWVCSGQSNMELPIARVKDRYPEEIAAAKNPWLRQFKIDRDYDFRGPREDLESGCWTEVNADSIFDFSAAAYFFAKKLYELYKIPIGLINNAVGGSPVEAWLSREVLQDYPGKIKEAKKFVDPRKIEKVQKSEQQSIENWFGKLAERDSGLKEERALWASPQIDIADWSEIEIPVSFAEVGLTDFKGVVWLRKEIDLPARLLDNSPEVRLQLGTIVDSDTAYINGQEVGRTEYRYPPRKYELSADILQPGKNIIAVRVVCNNGEGGFIKEKPYQLEIGEKTINLEEKWLYRVGARIKEPLPEETFFEWLPTGLYNGSIAPLQFYKIRGVIWYQGESNVGRAREYEELFPALIKDWRQKWGQKSFSFLYVQLPNYGLTGEGSEGWAELREAQLAALRLPQTAMVTAIDIGEWNELHPENKKDIGERLALAARGVTYGEDVTYCGPLYSSHRKEGSSFIISFDYVDGGLTVRGADELKGFYLAGDDDCFLPAVAQINDDRVVVYHDEIVKPRKCRYAWADNPEEANLYNKAGLPAAPFRFRAIE